LKRVLIIPRDSTGIVDVRKLKYLTLENVQYLEQITAAMLQNNMNKTEYKYCQFSQDEKIPVALKIVDRINNGPLVEFDYERVSFESANLDDTEDLIENRYLLPLKQEKQAIIGLVVEMMVDEKLGGKITDEDYKEVKKQNSKIDREIKNFDFKKYLKKLV